MAKIKVNKAQLNKKPKKNTKVKIKVEKKPKLTHIQASERRWAQLAQKISDKSEVVSDYAALLKDKAKEKIHDISFKVAAYVEKDDTGTSKFTHQVAMVKTKFNSLLDKYTSSKVKVDPLEIQRFESEGGTAKAPLKTSQEL